MTVEELMDFVRKVAMTRQPQADAATAQVFIALREEAAQILRTYDEMNRGTDAPRD